MISLFINPLGYVHFMTLNILSWIFFSIFFKFTIHSRTSSQNLAKKTINKTSCTIPRVQICPQPSECWLGTHNLTFESKKMGVKDYVIPCPDLRVGMASGRLPPVGLNPKQTKKCFKIGIQTHCEKCTSSN